MKDCKLRFSAKLYQKEAVLKAAYHFIDRCYVYLDCVEGYYEIYIKAKKNICINEIEDEFTNELLAQTVRLQVYKQTHVIREVLMARAMSSTIMDQNNEGLIPELPDQVDELENILMDWFEKNEK